MIKEPDWYDEQEKNNAGDDESHECIDTATGEVADV